MKHTLLLALLLAAACGAPLSAAAPAGAGTACTAPAAPQSESETVSPEYLEAVTEFLKNSGSYEALEAVTPQLRQMMEQTIRSASPDPEEALQITDEFFKDFTLDLVRIIAQSYQKHLGLDDLRAYNDFFRTAAGRRIAQAMPQLSKELYQVSARYGTEKMQSILQTLKEKKLLKEL